MDNHSTNTYSDEYFLIWVKSTRKSSNKLCSTSDDETKEYLSICLYHNIYHFHRTFELYSILHETWDLDWYSVVIKAWTTSSKQRAQHYASKVHVLQKICQHDFPLSLQLLQQFSKLHSFYKSLFVTHTIFELVNAS